MLELVVFKPVSAHKEKAANLLQCLCSACRCGFIRLLWYVVFVNAPVENKSSAIHGGAGENTFCTSLLEMNFL